MYAARVLTLLHLYKAVRPRPRWRWWRLYLAFYVNPVELGRQRSRTGSLDVKG